MLILPIKKKWFDMIASGDKKEEYREIKPYYTSRFREIKMFDIITVTFRNGYKKDSPSIKCKVECSRGCGKPNWGAEPNKEYYVLKIISVEEVSK